ncbi:MAG: acyl-CoA reductase [Flavobacteriales bacterium]|nr:acyl-CoA reductase [Flavobacteriales bacterium]
MELATKKRALSELGIFFQEAVAEYKGESIKTKHVELTELRNQLVNTIDSVKHENGWFTSESVLSALEAWTVSLQEDKIDKWLSPYLFDNISSKKVGIIMAGNLPLVGLHDALCVLVSGNQLYAKLSSKDRGLMIITLNALKSLTKEWSSSIVLTENMKEIDVLIATGSDNSARYFDYYFREKKRLIRKNRTSIAVLNGNETEQELEGLSHDIFTHYGLGCRNVTKLYVPKNYDLDHVFKALFPYKEIANHNKYANNYDYNKAIYLLNKVELIENGFILFKEDEGLHSPVGVLFYEFYDSLDDLEHIMEQNKDSIQCIVTNENLKDGISFGKAQAPELWDYADGVDTIEFLL